MEKNLFIRRLDALESRAFMDKEQYKTILKISLMLILVLCIGLTFKNDILSFLRHPEKTTAALHKDIQAVKIAAAE